MAYDKNLIAGKLRRWETYLNNYTLPQWEEIPNFGLYMEQVIVLLKKYLDYLPPEIKDEQFITAATINNYVRKKIMPEPIKKKYYRTHIACLIMIYSLKQSLSITMLQGVIPVSGTESEVEAAYSAYVNRHRLTAHYFVSQIRLLSAKLLDHETDSSLAAEDTLDLIITASVISGFSRLLSEKLILLDGQTLESIAKSE